MSKDKNTGGDGGKEGDGRAEAAGLGHLKGRHREQLERGTALADRHSGDMPRDHHMYEEPAAAPRPEPGR